MIFSPRDNFRATPHLKGWSDLVASDQFQAAATAALLHITSQLPATENAEDAAANLYRLQGASRFLHALMNLAESEADKKSPSNTTKLQYKV